MKLNNIKSLNSKFNSKRLGRGHSSGKGKTCGKGHKGQKARSGGYHKVGFEGGQTPLYKRVPKFGFNSRKKTTMIIRLEELNKIKFDNENYKINIEILKKYKLIKNTTEVKNIKIIYKGNIDKPYIIDGINCTKGVHLAIKQAGGKIIIDDKSSI